MKMALPLRKLVATVCLLLLLLLLALGGATADARPATLSVHRKVAPRRKLSSDAPASVRGGYSATGDRHGEDAKMSPPFTHRRVAGKGKPPPKNVVAKSVELLEFIDVNGYGAAGDGRSDDTPAFQAAWAEACSSAQPAVLLVPSGKKHLVTETVFSGPCKSQVTLRLDATVDNLTVAGQGTLDGNGNVWWKNSCRVNKKLPCTLAPSALTFSACKHLRVENIRLLNSPQIHLWVDDCQDVTLSRIKITASGDSPETDGIHVSQSEDVRIMNASIKTGDDCISIETGTKNLYAFNTECGPGHGISIGSLGDHNSEAQVSYITIDTAHISGAMFGARIKSWQGGRGYATDIKFMNMVMDNVKNPIVIDQNYCTMVDPSKPKPCEQQQSAVQFSSILFKNIKGTTTSKDAIKLHCSEAFPCLDVVLQDINLEMKARGDKNVATSTCENVTIDKLSNVSPVPCTTVLS
ncbi:hypothetical protein ACP4OV_020092 [Aristida adscensionis]